MTENCEHRPWLLVIIGSVLTTVLTTLLTVGGSYWLEQRKAKIELAKDVSQKQEIALEKLDHDLTSLDGSVFYMFKLEQGPGTNRALEKQAIDAATVMADIFQDNRPLDDSFESKHAIHELSESLAPLLADLRDNPTRNSVKLQAYYPSEFVPKLKRAQEAVERDQKRAVQALP